MKTYEKYLNEVLNSKYGVFPNELKGLTIKKVSQEVIPAEDDYEEDHTLSKYEIILKGEPVGEINSVGHGEMFGRPLPNILSYEGENIQAQLINFFKTMTGQKWLGVSIKRGF